MACIQREDKAFASAVAVAFAFSGSLPQRRSRREKPEGRRAGMHAVFLRDRGEPEIGEALLRPGERAGAVRRLPRPQLHRSWVA